MMISIDLNSAELARIFTGGNRDSIPEQASAFAIDDDRILVNIGGRMVMLDTRLAIEAVSQATSSQ